MKRFKSVFLLISILSMAALPIISHGETIRQFIKNSTVTAKVKEKYLTDPDIQSLHISVKTQNSYLILKGYVRTEAQKQKALEVALHIHGVNGVIDHLVVKPVESKPKKVSGLQGKN